MPKDFLLTRAGDFHLAIPTSRLLEIVDLTDSKKEISAHTPLKTHILYEENRIWRDHMLPVIHLGHYLAPEKKPALCTESLVFQVSEHEIIFLDIDHIFGIVHLKENEMRPLYRSTRNLAPISTYVCDLEAETEYAIAYILEETPVFSPSSHTLRDCT
jgi:hypothetical protein